MDTLSKFLEFIKIDTTSDSRVNNNPSTKIQLEFAKLLVNELKNIGVEVYFDEKHAYVYGILRGNELLPKIGFVSHMDTCEDASGKNINAKISYNYNGKDIALGENKILSVEKYPELKRHVGETLITTKGSTLLGADDKAGIVEILGMLEYFSESNESHGDIYVCFTPDEEIGLGTLNLDYNIFKPDYAFTVDGVSVGELSYENFYAATAKIKIKGISSHCGFAKGNMVNASRVAILLNDSLPNEIPENTEGKEGFFHLDKISGDVSNAYLEYLIRDFDFNNFNKRKDIIKMIAKRLNKLYGECIEVEIKDSYKNMYEVVSREKEFLEETKKSIECSNGSVSVVPIRGGCDGTEISFNGIVCPNIGTGGHNFHSVYEYITLEDIEKNIQVLISLVRDLSKNLNVQRILK